MGRTRHFDRARPSPPPMKCASGRCATGSLNPLRVPVQQSGCAGESRTTRCAIATTATSDGRCGGKVVRPDWRRAGMPLPTTAIKPAVAPPSHTSAGARCRQAGGNRCGHNPGNGSVEWAPGSGCRVRHGCDRLCDDIDRAATGRSTHSAGRRVVDIRRGCRKVKQDAVAGR